MKNTLRVRRAEKGDGVSQRDVWKALGMERNRYWRIEQGDLPPTAKEVKALARYFRCPADVLFPGLATKPDTGGSGEAASVA